MERSLEKLLMIIHAFMDLQRFIVRSWFIVKEMMTEKGERSLPLHFCKPPTMESTYKIRQVLRFLVDCESSWIAMGSRDGPVQHGETSYYIDCFLITLVPKMMTLSYVKRYTKREWLKDMLESDARDDIIETLNANYEDIELNNH